jgi:hypothetical protein
MERPKFRGTRNTLLQPNPMATRRKTRPSTPRIRRLDGAYAKLDAGYKNKGDAMMARSIDFKQKSNLARGIND